MNSCQEILSNEFRLVYFSLGSHGTDHFRLGFTVLYLSELMRKIPIPYHTILYIEKTSTFLSKNREPDLFAHSARRAYRNARTPEDWERDHIQ